MADRTRVQAVIEGLLARVIADAPLVALLDALDTVAETPLYARETVELIERPGVYYELVDTGLTEGFEPVLIRWHIWAKPQDVLAIEAALRLVAHPESQVTLGGATVIARLAASYAAGGSKRVAMARRIVETSLEIVRQRATV